jgi:hypothetical protein
VREQHNVPPFIKERHCLNCAKHNLCWDGRDADEMIITDHFAYKADWTPEALMNHFKRCIGGLCNNFETSIATKDLDKQWDK